MPGPGMRVYGTHPNRDSLAREIGRISANHGQIRLRLVPSANVQTHPSPMACIPNQCFQALMNHRQTPRRDRTNAASTFYTVLTDRTQDKTAGSSYNPNRHPTASQTVTTTTTAAQSRKRTCLKRTSVQKARKRIPKYTRNTDGSVQHTMGSGPGEETTLSDSGHDTTDSATLWQKPAYNQTEIPRKVNMCTSRCSTHRSHFDNPWIKYPNAHTNNLQNSFEKLHRNSHTEKPATRRQTKNTTQSPNNFWT